MSGRRGEACERTFEEINGSVCRYLHSIDELMKAFKDAEVCSLPVGNRSAGISLLYNAPDLLEEVGGGGVSAHLEFRNSPSLGMSEF